MNRRQVVATRVITVAYFALLQAATHWPRLDLAALMQTRNDALLFGLDKWAHVGAFGLLSLLICLSFWTTRRPMRTAGIAAIALLAYCGADEWSQTLFEGRTPSVADWVADAIGVLGGAASFVVLRWLGGTGNDAGFAVHTRLVSALTLVSRLFGLMRDWALWRALGFGAAYDAFAIAFMIPNLFRRMFGEGALAAAFIPHYARLREADEPTGRRFAAQIVVRLTLVLLALTALALVVIGLVAAWMPAESRGLMATQLSAVTIGYMPLVCVAAILGAMLQVHRRFAVPAASPIVLNLVLIIAALLPASMLGDRTPEFRVYVIAWSLLLAGLLQVGWHLVAVADAADGWTPLRPNPGRSSVASVALGEVNAAHGKLLRQWAPTVVGLAVFQVNVLADSLIAMAFSGPEGETIAWLGFGEYPIRVGAVGVLGSGARLYEFPLGVFGIALATAIFPLLSAAATDRAAFSDLLRRGLRLAVFIGLPASVGLILVRYPLSHAIYFSAEDAARVAWVLAGYAPAVWAYSMNHVLTRAFYAHHDATTPMRVAMGMVALNITLNLLLIWPLGVAGLAFSTAICATLQSVVLLVLVRRHSDAPTGGGVWRSWLGTGAATAAMTLVVWAMLEFVPEATVAGWFAPLGEGMGAWLAVIAQLLAAASVGGLVFVGVAAAMRMPELRWLIERGESPDTPGEPVE